MRMCLLVVGLAVVQAAGSASEVWPRAEANATDAREAIQFCHRYAFGWLNQADPATGLLPRTVHGAAVWNSQDCAADNFPFLVLTAHVTDNYYLKRAVAHILDQEIRLTTRVDGLPDTYDFAKRGFATESVNWDAILFGASEYVKDGLMPITEWMGPSPWETRMLDLLQGVWRHAEVETPAGKAPTANIEVHGELLQSMSRMYWRTGDTRFKEWCYRLTDLYLLHKPLIEHDHIRLRDHGCEVLSGLSETYVIAAREDPERRATWRDPLHALLDRILDKAVDADGMMPNVFSPTSGKVVDAGISDGWGYVYNAYLTVAMVDDVPRYRDAVRHALENIHKHLETDWEHGSADGYADSIEGALNMLNRIPVASAFDWVDQSIRLMWAKQRPDGIIEGWYGDGNSARTSIMYALWKTQGLSLAPWREDMRLGAVLDDEVLYVSLSTDNDWRGALRFDRKRHAEYLNMPEDYPRINQFPEWFTADRDAMYTIQVQGKAPQHVRGEELWSWPLEMKAGEALRLAVRKDSNGAKDGEALLPWRSMQYVPGSAEETRAWQTETRAALMGVLRVADQISGPRPALTPEITGEASEEGYRRMDLKIASTPGRRIPVVVTMPDPMPSEPVPAVVCVHGHGGDRNVVYEDEGIYKTFARALARTGYITIATDVGQHEVHESGRTLLGERLWDLVRCVDYLESMPEVDTSRIGCAGLSLGGEMCMWLAAMDTRLKATVSAGFLTKMDQLEQNHCMCWKEEGLRALVDFPDIYGLIAPRALQCQNGRQEPASQFPVPLAEAALAEIQPVYAALGAPENAVLHPHDGAHEIDLPALTWFLAEHLR